MPNFGLLAQLFSILDIEGRMSYLIYGARGAHDCIIHIKFQTSISITKYFGMQIMISNFQTYFEDKKISEISFLYIV